MILKVIICVSSVLGDRYQESAFVVNRRKYSDSINIIIRLFFDQINKMNFKNKINAFIHNSRKTKFYKNVTIYKCLK